MPETGAPDIRATAPATFAQVNVPGGVALDSAGNVYVADSKNYLVRLLTPSSSGISAVQNAASAAATPVAAQPIPGTVAAPGEIVVLYGNFLGPPALVVNQPVNGVYGTYLAGIGVNFDGYLAPILYASATHIAVIVPYEEAIGNTAQLTVTYNNQTTLAAPVIINYTAPGIFTVGGNGVSQASAVNQDKTCNGVAAPVVQVLAHSAIRRLRWERLSRCMRRARGRLSPPRRGRRAGEGAGLFAANGHRDGQSCRSGDRGVASLPPPVRPRTPDHRPPGRADRARRIPESGPSAP